MTAFLVALAVLWVASAGLLAWYATRAPWGDDSGALYDSEAEWWAAQKRGRDA